MLCHLWACHRHSRVDGCGDEGTRSGGGGRWCGDEVVGGEWRWRRSLVVKADPATSLAPAPAAQWQSAAGTLLVASPPLGPANRKGAQIRPNHYKSTIKGNTGLTIN